jgi:hypothetical protein
MKRTTTTIATMQGTEDEGFTPFVSSRQWFAAAWATGVGGLGYTQGCYTDETSRIQSVEDLDLDRNLRNLSQGLQL